MKLVYLANFCGPLLSSLCTTNYEINIVTKYRLLKCSMT